jgi:hypothetical protein
MKLPRVWTIALAALLAAIAASFVYWKHFPKDGSSIDRAIVLREHGDEAVPEEWQWIAKLHPGAHRLEWEHATSTHHGRFYSYYLLTTPRGKEDIYFDTGNPAK